MGKENAEVCDKFTANRRQITQAALTDDANIAAMSELSKGNEIETRCPQAG
jgi:hypothetical protein